MVAGRRSAPAPAAAEEEVEGKQEEGDEGYLRIQLEEIVIVKNDAYDTLAAATASAHADGYGNSQCSGAASASASMDKCGKAATAVVPGGGPTTGTAAAARSAWTTVARIVGFD